jgi:hypothetical protein
MRRYITQHLADFVGELNLPLEARRDAEGRAERVARSLFAEYYPDQAYTGSCYAIAFAGAEASIKSGHFSFSDDEIDALLPVELRENAKP